MNAQEERAMEVASGMSDLIDNASPMGILDLALTIGWEEVPYVIELGLAVFEGQVVSVERLGATGFPPHGGKLYKEGEYWQVHWTPELAEYPYRIPEPPQPYNRAFKSDEVYWVAQQADRLDEWVNAYPKIMLKSLEEYDHADV